MANDASRATAAKEAAKAKLKARMAAMVSTNSATGAPQVNVVPTKQVVAPASGPAKSASSKSKVKTKMKAKAKEKPGFWDPNTND